MISVNIGAWMSYSPYHDPEQLKLQRENILRLPIENSYGRIGFILSKNIDNLEKYLENISKQIKIEDTETVLDTEVYYTSKIEGARTTKKRTFEIHNGAPINNDDFSECMIKGNFEAVKLLNLYGNIISEDILYKVWNILTDGCRDNEDIQGNLYRNDEVGVYGSDFKAIKADNIKSCMDELIDFYNGNILNDRPFIKAAILHFTFETIHPFCDGNGRFARLWQNVILSGYNTNFRGLVISNEINKSLSEYYKVIQDAEFTYNNMIDITPFIEYMLKCICSALDYMTIRRYVKLGPTESQVLLRMQKSQAGLTVKKVMELQGLAEGTAYNLLNRLVSKGYAVVDKTYRPYRYYAK